MLLNIVVKRNTGFVLFSGSSGDMGSFLDFTNLFIQNLVCHKYNFLRRQLLQLGSCYSWAALAKRIQCLQKESMGTIYNTRLYPGSGGEGLYPGLWHSCVRDARGPRNEGVRPFTPGKGWKGGNLHAGTHTHTHKPCIPIPHRPEQVRWGASNGNTVKKNLFQAR